MWYYTENGEQRGPVTDPDLEALVQAGKIDDETLVWREGQADWQPYRTVKPTPPVRAERRRRPRGRSSARNAAGGSRPGR